VAITLRTKRPDQGLKQVVGALGEYDKAHPQAEIETYRQNSVSVRVRVIDPDFEGKSRAQREEELWGVLDQLPEEVVAEISQFLLLTPEEAKRSFANVEFDNPVPSKL
jgi:stress-induced morphogen